MKGLVGSRYSTVISNLERMVAFAEDAGLTSHWFIHHFKGLLQKYFLARSSQESPQYSQQPSKIGIWEASSVVLITTTTNNNSSNSSNSSNNNKNKNNNNNNNNRTYWERLHQALGRLR